jgi:hypothetical protein
MKNAKNDIGALVLAAWKIVVVVGGVRVGLGVA